MDRIVAHGTIQPPRSYEQAAALRHLHEAITTTVRENRVRMTLVWQIEGNARVNMAMRPRLRAEGVVCAAALIAGSSASLVAWSEIESRAKSGLSKKQCEQTNEVCGIEVGTADPLALIVAVAAAKG
jgi:hypothetical protein